MRSEEQVQGGVSLDAMLLHLLVYSVDGVLCEVTKAAEEHLARLLAKKWERNYS